MTDTQQAIQEQLCEMREDSRATVNDFFSVDYTYPVSVAHSTSDLLKHGLLPWAKSGIRKSIIIRIPGITQDQLIHEMSHFALRTMTAGRPLPLWFDEGLACHVSEMDFGGSRLQLKRASEAGELPNTIAWKGLHGKFLWLNQMYIKKNTGLVYSQCFHMMAYLIETYSKPRLLEFIRSLSQADFEESFKQSFGLSQDDFYENFIGGL